MAGRKMKNRRGSGFRATPVKVFLSGVSCRIHYAIRSELRLEAAISEDSARRDADMSGFLREKSRPITFRRTSEPEGVCCQPNCQGDVISRRRPDGARRCGQKPSAADCNAKLRQIFQKNNPFCDNFFRGIRRGLRRGRRSLRGGGRSGGCGGRRSIGASSGLCRSRQTSPRCCPCRSRD